MGRKGEEERREESELRKSRNNRPEGVGGKSERRKVSRKKRKAHRSLQPVPKAH